jgi:hypothetical protein
MNPSDSVEAPFISNCQIPVTALEVDCICFFVSSLPRILLTEVLVHSSVVCDGKNFNDKIVTPIAIGMVV